MLKVIKRAEGRGGEAAPELLLGGRGLSQRKAQPWRLGAAPAGRQDTRLEM